jgi:hypothetical protein
MGSKPATEFLSDAKTPKRGLQTVRREVPVAWEGGAGLVVYSLFSRLDSITLKRAQRIKGMDDEPSGAQLNNKVNGNPGANGAPALRLSESDQA